MKISWQQNSRKCFQNHIHNVMYYMFGFYMQKRVLYHLLFHMFTYSIILKRYLLLWLSLQFIFQIKNMRRIKVWESEAAVSCNNEALLSHCVSSVHCCHRAVTKQRWVYFTHVLHVLLHCSVVNRSVVRSVSFFSIFCSYEDIEGLYT